MELAHDWIGFQKLFYPQSHSASTRTQSSSPASVYLVLEGDIIVEAFSENEDLSDWLGGSYEQISSQFTNRYFMVFERESVDKWLQESLKLPHYYDQVEYLRQQALPTRLPDGSRSRKAMRKKMARLSSKHFLLEGVQGWWDRFMPSSYGFFIRVEGARDQEMLLLVRRGTLVAFHQPDLSYLGEDRSQQPSEVVKYLSEKYLTPVQGLFVPEKLWKEWAFSAHPWRLVTRAFRAHEARMVPFRWGLVTMMNIRALLRM